MTKSLIPYTYYSQSAQRLKSVLTGWKYNKPADINVNFGSTQKVLPCTHYINHPTNVANAVNKYKCFMRLHNKVPIPRFTKFKHKAETFSRPIYERKRLKATKGKGIVVNNDQPLGNARMYVEGLNTKREYRTIILGDKVVTTMIKVPRHSRNPDWTVRNLANGWRFSYKTPYPKELKLVTDTAIKALQVLKLDFGAVDLIVDQSNKVYVLEVNTAFGLGKHNVELFKTALETYTTEKEQQCQQRTN